MATPMGNDALFVAIGAVPGAWLRFRIVNHFEPMLPRKHWGTFGVNLIACFAIGLLVSLQTTCGLAAVRTLLLLGTGFLGSFSTFSTWIAELHDTLQRQQRREAVLLCGGSVLGGLLAVGAGLALGSS
ncbi:fluoride efflux transporter FluC [Synechococcus sp. BA-132 BA5]|uniref:fluoride efflux transporter FluC n=1 Tax=Synechococcus sp. BA-132 BA5 TaxID=3110252 RepID=UPI002B21DF41|nr:CrcB family protein [Synechococcus sp. BA-132 BA5]MEA5416237.1 CrcB family protein [Synechococcus sp. BA-132 BA5]